MRKATTHNYYRRIEDNFSEKVTETFEKLKAEPDMAIGIRPVVPCTRTNYPFRQLQGQEAGAYEGRDY